MVKITIFFALLVALIGLSAAEFRVKRQTLTGGVPPNQANLNPYNPYDPYNSYNPYNPYNPYNSFNPYRAPFQSPQYPGLPGQSVYPGQRAQPGLAPQ